MDHNSKNSIAYKDNIVTIGEDSIEIFNTNEEFEELDNVIFLPNDKQTLTDFFHAIFFAIQMYNIMSINSGEQNEEEQEQPKIPNFGSIV